MGSKKPPEFDTFEELQAYLDKENGGKKKKSKKKKKGSVAQSDDSQAAVPPESIWCKVHYFLQPNATWQTLLYDAKEERAIRNDNVRVFVHKHHAEAECEDACREILGSDVK